MSTYQEIKSLYEKISIISGIKDILLWDNFVNLPIGCGEVRAKQLSILDEQIENLCSNAKTQTLIDNVDAEKLGCDDLSNFKLIKNYISQYLTTNPKLREKINLVTSQCENDWKLARQQNNFLLVKDSLSELILLKKEWAYSQKNDSSKTLYDVLLDKYDRGSKESFLDESFYKIEEKLKNILPSKNKKVKTIANSQTNIMFTENEFNYIQNKLIKIMNFDYKKGRIDQTIHPFCGGIAQDVRLAIYKNKRDISSIYALIHELGHAIYRQNLPKKWADQPLGELCSSAIDESQALLFEFYISRSDPFKGFLIEMISRDLGYSKNLVQKKVFDSYCDNNSSFIRVNASHNFYPLHIIMRYKIEKEMFSNNFNCHNLPELWNEEFYNLFNIYPPDDINGCLQDIHWYIGLFGYFPTYLIGNMCAAQFYEKISVDLPNLTQSLSCGNISDIIKWCNINIHNKGKLFTTKELIYNVCGNELSEKYLLNYL